jgi:hypothetical protein
MSQESDCSSYNSSITIGPGVWYGLHLEASEIKTKEDAISCFKSIDRIKRRFSCEVCRKHFEEECKKNSPKIAMVNDIKRLESDKQAKHLFIWLVNAHNQANINKFNTNKILGRPNKTQEPVFVSVQTVRKYFDPFNITPCIGTNCDDSSLETPVAKTSPRPQKSPEKPRKKIETKETVSHSSLFPNNPIIVNSSSKIKFLPKFKKSTYLIN